jgi:hypothetical protein
MLQKNVDPIGNATSFLGKKSEREQFLLLPRRFTSLSPPPSFTFYTLAHARAHSVAQRTLAGQMQRYI